tara:strand:- start:166 stop:474 length:309 start_codon:yes stop_codon:yes gene_type:complete
MKIVNFKLYTKGKLRAFFDLKLDLHNDQWICIKGFKIMEGINGLFVSVPSQQKDGDWYDTVFCSKSFREELGRIAVDFYNQESDTSKTYPSNETTADKEIPF